MAEPSFKDLAYRALASTIGGPVDIATMFMRPFGYNVPPEQVFGSSEYLGRQLEQGGLVSEARDPTQEFLASMMVPSPNLPIKAVGILPEIAAGLMGVTAYHGSPYLFKQFDPMRAGTGEGAQNYGFGAGYTSEGKPVASRYIPKGEDIESFTVKETGEVIDKNDPRFLDIADTMDRMVATGYLDDFLSQVSPKGGYLYKGDIPDELIPDMMDWNKPFSEQPEKVKNAFRRLFNDPNVSDEETRKWFKETYKGPMGNYYDQLAMSFNLSGKEDVSRLLSEQGIPGIKYSERGTKGVGEGTTNYVVFRPKDFKIETINEEPIEEWIRKGLLD